MATIKTTPCECGCGKATIRPEAHFIPGHDAKLKSELIRTALAGGPAAKKAEAAIASRGWELHLAISRAKADRIASQKARSAAAKTGARAPVTPAKPKVAKPAAKPGDKKTASGGTVPASVGTLRGALAAVGIGSTGDADIANPS